VPELVLDNVSYPVIDSVDIPVGFGEVDVILDDNGVTFPCMMVSGHLAFSVEGEKKDTIRPIPSWFMFVKGDTPDDDIYMTHEEKGKGKEKKTKWNWRFWNM